MGLRVGHQIGFENNDHLQCKGELFVVELSLIELGADLVLDGGFLQLFGIHLMDIDFQAILGLGTGSRMLPGKSRVQCRVVTQLRNQVQIFLADHGGTGIVAKMVIQRHVTRK